MRRMVVGVVLVAMVVLGWRHQPASVSALTRPNIIFVYTDDQTYHSLTKMPYLSSRPEGRWTTFDRAFVNVSLSNPARATVLNGQYSHTHGVEHNNLVGSFDETQTLPVWLKASGYTTALVGKYMFEYPYGQPAYIPPGWDYWAEGQGYYNYKLYENGTTVTRGSTEADYSSDVFTAKANAYLNNQTSQQPFFLYLGYNAPHDPRTPAKRHQVTPVPPGSTRPNFNEADVTDKPKWVRALPKLTAAQATTVRQKQTSADLALKAVDEGLQTLINTLKTKNLLSNTVIMFTTDNAYAFGEHRVDQKICPYEECLHVPLLIRHPEVAANQNVAPVVNNTDLVPTILDMAGASATIAMDGRSMLPLMLTPGSAQWDDGALVHWIGGYSGGAGGPYAGVYQYWGVRTMRYKYVEYTNGDKELYDLNVDPYELVSKAGKPAFASIQAGLAQKLAALRGLPPPTTTTLPPDNTAPTAPTNLKTTGQTTTTISLAWTAATDNVGVTNYLLYRNGALVKTLGKVLTYKDAGLTKNTAYTYTLYATDAAGNRSPASNTITVRTKLV